MKNYFLAIATMVGTVIGVGIFTLPFIFYQSGIIFLPIYMVVFGFIQYYLHLLFAEVILSTKGYHRLPGYVERYSGKKMKYFTLILAMISDYGVIIAYIIVGGLFLSQLLIPFFGGSVLLYTTILFAIEVFIVFCGLKLIAEFEFFATILMVIVIGMIAFKGGSYFSFDNYNIIQLKNIFMPYGPVFFAVGGATAIPVMCKLLEKNKEKIKSAIFWGTIIPIIAMSIFIIIAIGITGNKISSDTLSSFSLIFKNGIISFTLIFGILAISTSFLTIAQTLKDNSMVSGLHSSFFIVFGGFSKFNKNY